MTNTTSFYPEATNYATMGDNISLITGLIILLVFLGLCVGLIILQVYLSKRESMWPGLILPIITFCFSLSILLGMALFSTNTGVTHVELRLEAIPVDEYGLGLDSQQRIAEINERFAGREFRPEELEYYRETIVNHLMDYGQIRLVGPRIAFILVMFNIPTAIFMAIYAGCRGKRRKQRSLELMSVQDLE